MISYIGIILLDTAILSLCASCALLCKSVSDLNKRIEDLWDFILNV